VETRDIRRFKFAQLSIEEPRCDSGRRGPILTQDGASIARVVFGLMALQGVFDEPARAQSGDESFEAGAPLRVSASSTAARADGHASDASIPSDGNVVAFESLTTNSVGQALNAVADAFVYDTLTDDLESVRACVGSHSPATAPCIHHAVFCAQTGALAFTLEGAPRTVLWPTLATTLVRAAPQ
jgi:hypothetical protein